MGIIITPLISFYRVDVYITYLGDALRGAWHAIRTPYTDIIIVNPVTTFISSVFRSTIFVTLYF